MRFGFTESQWMSGKAEMLEVLKRIAARGDTITYGKLSDSVREIKIAPHDFAMAAMLGEISAEEDAEGRGMLSALVIHKHGDQVPGNGFYDCAKQLGRDVSDRTKFWAVELQRVYDYWAKAHKPR